MKKQHLILTFMAAAIFTSCQKENEDTYTPSEADAAMVVEQSLEKSSGGMADEAAKLGDRLFGNGLGQQLQCNVAYDSTLTYFLNGDATGMWVRNWSLLLTCAEGESPSLNVDTDYEGNLVGPIQTRTRQGSRNWTYDNLGPNGEPAVMNGSGEHSGSRTFSVGDQNTFSWEQSASWTAVQINKETHEILSGSGVFTLTFSNSLGNTTVFEGTVTFNGGGSATITINGNEYQIGLG